MGVAHPTFSRRGFVHRALTLLFALGVLAYLGMPLLHAVHAGGESERPPGQRDAHVALCHHHAHAHPHAPGDDGDKGPSPGEGHDPESCGVCRVFYTIRVAADLPASLTAPEPFESRLEPMELKAQRVVVVSASPERPLRGPPAA